MISNTNWFINSDTSVISSQISINIIPVDSLRITMFPEKKVIKEEPLSIDQMVAAALSRVNSFIQAEAAWSLIILHQTLFKKR